MTIASNSTKPVGYELLTGARPRAAGLGRDADRAVSARSVVESWSIKGERMPDKKEIRIRVIAGLSDLSRLVPGQEDRLTRVAELMDQAIGLKPLPAVDPVKRDHYQSSEGRMERVAEELAAGGSFEGIPAAEPRSELGKQIDEVYSKTREALAELLEEFPGIEGDRLDSVMESLDEVLVCAGVNILEED